MRDKPMRTRTAKVVNRKALVLLESEEDMRRLASIRDEHGSLTGSTLCAAGVLVKFSA